MLLLHQPQASSVSAHLTSFTEFTLMLMGTETVSLV